MSGEEVFVRMGELAVSRAATEVLTTIGLGSCVGLVLLDAGQRAAGLVHVVFPESPSGSSPEDPGKYADTAVPALINAMWRLGCIGEALEAVLIGGARMFSFARSAGLDIGASNVQAVSQALDHARIPIRDALTGGSVGRSVRVHAAEGRIAVREGGVDSRLYTASRGVFEELVVL